MNHNFIKKWPLFFMAVLVVGLLLNLGPIAQAAGTITVEKDISCVTGSGQADPYTAIYCDIQDAIDDAISGDIINVAAGIYYETLNITTNDLQIIGEDRATVVIDPTGLATNNAGIYVDADDVTLQWLTLQSTVTNSLPRYGIKFGAVAGGTLADVTVQDLYRSGIDALGSSNLTISNVSSLNNGDHGLSLVDCNGVTVTDITLSGNGWQNVSVATWGRYTPLGTSGIVFAGTNSFGDLFQLEMGDYNNPGVPPAGDAIITYSTNPADGADVTVQASDFGFALHGEQDDGPDQARIWFFSTLANAAIVPPLAPIGHWSGNGMYIEDLNDGTQLHVTPGGSIQAAVNAASVGDVINVATGTYNERVTINKSLDLRGAQYGLDPTPAGARITPANESIITEAGLPTPNPDVLIEIPSGVSDVTVDGFTLIGDPTNATADTSVVRGWDDNIALNNNIIDGLLGVLYKGGAGLTVHQNRMTVNKLGVIVQPNPASDVTISDNLFSLGSTPAGDESAMYMTACSQCNVTGNTATNFVNGRGTGGSNLSQLIVSGNTFAGNKDGVSIWGGSTFLTISDNDLSGSLRYGINIKGQDVDITGNQITNSGDVGVNVARHVIDTERVTIFNNNINGNTNFGVQVDTANVTEIVNASGNWWGTADGPAGVGSGSGDAISANVAYCPWLDGPYPGGSPTSADGLVTNLDTGKVFCGIQAAIDDADTLTGHTIDATAGTYDSTVETFPIVINKSLTLLGAQANLDPRPSQGGRIGSESIIDADETTNAVIQISANDVEINGFTITGGMGDMVEEDGSAHNLLLRYNILYDDLASAGDEAIQIKYSDGVIIEYNYVYDILQDAFNLSASSNGAVRYNEAHHIYTENAAIYCYDTTNIDIIGNLVYDVPNNDGLKLGDSGDGSTGGEVKDNVVHDIAEDGITIYASGVRVENNTIYNVGSENGALYLYGANNATVSQNKIYDNPAIGLLIVNTAGVTVEENEIYNNDDNDDSKYSGSAGIWVTADAANVVIYNNSIHDNAELEIRNEAAAVLDASGNWLGSNTPAGVVAAVSSNVDYTPWLDSETDTSGDPGFQGDFSTLHVDDDSPQSGATGYLQEGVDMVSGSTVIMAAGTYADPVDVDGFSGLTITGVDKTTVIIKPATTLCWGLGYGCARRAVFRVANSTDVVLQNMTMDFDLVKANNLYGILYWDSTGTVDHNIIKNMSVSDAAGGYSEIGSYYRAPGYTDAARANVEIADNIFIDAGRVALLTHNYVHATISGNTFYKTIADFGYAIEIGSESTGSISGNTIYGYDTAALSDGSNSAGIYIENAFTGPLFGGTANLDKNVSVADNEIYNSQWALYIGNEFHQYAGDVDIAVTLNNNNFHNNLEGGVSIADEDKEFGSSVSIGGGRNTLTSNGGYGYHIHTAGDGDIMVNLTEETITGHDTGVYVADSAAGASSSSYNVLINLSNIYGNSTAGVDNTIGSFTVDAKYDWWGAADGPSGVGSGSGDAVSANVAYCPWLDGPYPGGSLTSAGGLVTNLDTGEVFCSIQAAIDDTDTLPGHTIEATTGTYNESVTINKDNLTLQGETGSQPAITGGLKFDTDLAGLTFKNFVVTGSAASNSIVRMYGAITGLTIDNCVFDGQNVSGRLGFSGGQLEGDVTITNSEFKNILGWALLDSRSGSGGDGSALGTVTFAGNHIHDSNGSVVFRGLSTDRTAVVNVYGNTWENIGGANNEQGQHWTALEVNRTIEANVYNNTVNNVSLGEWGEGQAFQFWDIDTLQVHDNNITNNAQGIFIYGDAGGGLGGPFAVPGGSISNNNIVGNAAYGLDLDPAASGGPLNAECNWWGAINGPGPVGPGSGDMVSVNVDFAPWLLSPAPDGLCAAPSAITIVKEIEDDEDQLVFNFTGDLGEEDFSLTTNTPNNQRTFPDLLPGPYTVAEDETTLPENWYLLSVTCYDGQEDVTDTAVSDDENQADAEVVITLAEGQHLTCVFFNEHFNYEPEETDTDNSTSAGYQIYLPLFSK